MPSVSFPVTRPVGRALLVGTIACRLEPAKLLREQGYDCAEVDDPYAAMMQLARQRPAFQMLVLSLASLYREELSLIATVKRRLPHVEIWLAQTDGRVAALAEGVRLGADGFLAEDGTLHRVAPPQGDRGTLHSAMPAAHEPRRERINGNGTGGTELREMPTSDSSDSSNNNDSNANSSSVEDTLTIGEPVLTADELRALLQDQPSMPPSNAND